MLKLGTHNSMTYLKPADGVQEAGWIFGKCQDMTIDEQYDFGVRFFDLRIRFQPEGQPYFAHGFLEFFGVEPLAVIRELDRKGGCVIHLVLESNNSIARTQNGFFIDFCQKCEQEFSRTVFNGGWSKYPQSGEVVYTFRSGEVARREVYKVFTQLNSVVSDAKEMLSHLKENREKSPLNLKTLKELLKRGLEGGAEIAQGPIAFARQDNPEYWKGVNEESFTVMDFIEIGAPEAYLRQTGRIK